MLTEAQKKHLAIGSLVLNVAVEGLALAMWIKDPKANMPFVNQKGYNPVACKCLTITTAALFMTGANALGAMAHTDMSMGAIVPAQMGNLVFHIGIGMVMYKNPELEGSKKGLLIHGICAPLTLLGLCLAHPCKCCCKAPCADKK